MDLARSLTIFSRACDRRNFAAAARDLSVSQATVTRAVQTLERHFGVELIRRSTREMTLTDAGQRLYQGSEALLLAIADLQSRVSGTDSEVLSGALRITAPSAFGVTVLARVAATFCNRHPSVSLDLQLTDRYLDLVADNIDLAVRIGALSDSTLIQRKVAHIEEVLVAAPDYLGEERTFDHPAALQQHSFVTLSILRTAGTGIPLSSVDGTVATIYPSTALSFDTPLGVREALIAGAGIGRIHRYLVADDLVAGKLIEVLPGWRCPTWTMLFVTTARARSSAAEAFSEALRHALSGIRGFEPTPC